LLATVGLLAAVSACSSPRPPWADGKLVREERDPEAPEPTYGNLPQRLLAVHNRERAALGIAPLVWDSALAAAASTYGKQLARLGRLEHSPGTSRPGQGENLWMGTRNAYTIESMAGGWAAEKRIFRPGRFPNVSRSGQWSDVGHYTQMIWRGTRRVGCALERSRDWHFLVCRYAPAGNVVGQPVP